MNRGTRFGSTLLAAGLTLVMAAPAQAVTTFTVDRTTDQADPLLSDNVCDINTRPISPGHQCTFRAALQQANATANSGGADQIHFNIPKTGVQTLTPATAYPEITEPVTINGYTQPGATPNTLSNPSNGTNAQLMIELNGSEVPQADGLTIRGGGTTVRGLVINRFQELDPALQDGVGIFMLNIEGNTNNVIRGNFIGTDATGSVDLGNDSAGVLLSGQSTGNVIGGPLPADRNLISGNAGNGVALSSAGNTIEGNLIGTDRDGSADLGNGNSGVALSDGGNLVRRNVAAFNGSDGITVFFGSSNRILSNSLFGNDGLGIDLDADGTTPNDPLDPDTGPNTLQNKPVVDFAATFGETTIRAHLNSTPNKAFTVQFFSNAAGNEARTLRGQTLVTTDANGQTGTFEFVPATVVPPGHNITATATGPGGNTSELSAPRGVIDP